MVNGSFYAGEEHFNQVLLSQPVEESLYVPQHDLAHVLIPGNKR